MALKTYIYNLFGIIIVAYIINAVYTFYTLYNPPACDATSPTSTNTCVWPMCDCARDEIELFVYYGDSSPPSPEDFTTKTSQHILLLKKRFECNTEFNEDVKLPDTRSTAKSYAHIYAACLRSLEANTKIPLSAYHYYRSTISTRMGEMLEEKSEKILLSPDSNSTETVKKFPKLHVQKNLAVHVMQDYFILNRSAVVHELLPHIKIVPSPSADDKMVYLPVLFVDEMSRKRDDYLLAAQFGAKATVSGQNTTAEQSANLTISYSPIKLGKIRLFALLSHSFKQLKQLGFRQQDIEDVTGIFTDTNLYLLLLTMIISVIHIALDFMAFKNDISFWRTKGTRAQNRGLSARTVLWRLVSSSIIFLYLLDEKSSALVLVPSAVAIAVEAWKISKVWKFEIIKRRLDMPKNLAAAKSTVQRKPDSTTQTSSSSTGINFFGLLPWSLKISSISDARTERFDAEATKYLTWILYPICLGGAAYSLIYVKHRSWYSWMINSLVNGIYAFGFLFMVPQLFLNYRLKSVAHLPWRSFAYKAVNTFIDDLFAFIIRMPTAHRLACFRDDIVFVVYLVQRWIYPVDRTRNDDTSGTVDEDDNNADDVVTSFKAKKGTVVVNKESKKQQ